MAPRALIAGAGIGGLTTALALSEDGYETVLFERAPELAEFGAGLQLTPNATRILERFGVLELIREQATEPQAIRLLRGRDDEELSRLPIADAPTRWGAPYLIIHRADLQRTLAEAAAQRSHIELRLGFEVAGVAESSGGVTLGLKRGMLSLAESGAFAIGADGVRSKLRERIGMGGVESLTFSGRVAFRALVPSEKLPPDWSAPFVTLRLGRSAHLVAYPLRGGSVVNLVAVIESGWRGERGDDPWDGIADRPALERAFSEWTRETRRALSNAREWRAWPLFHRDPLASYAEGHVALVGDAAHPMVPFLAQGAGQAIEDAGALARQLSGATDIPAALKTYSASRVPRAGRVQREAIAQARIYHMAGAMAFARDLTMRALGAERLLARYNWLYAA